MSGHARTGSGITVEVAPGTYEHGTHAKYVLEKCRCKLCRAARTEYERQRSRDKLYGRPRTVDAAPVRAHIAKLLSRGMSAKRIQDTSGVSGTVLQGLLYGRRDRGTPPVQWVRAATAEKLMAVRFQPLSRYQVVKGEPVLAAWEAIADVMELGYAKSWIATQVISPDSRALQLSMDAMEARHVAAIFKLRRETKELRSRETHHDRVAFSRAVRTSERLRTEIERKRAELRMADRAREAALEKRDRSIRRKQQRKAERVNLMKAS